MEVKVWMVVNFEEYVVINDWEELWRIFKIGILLFYFLIKMVVIWLCLFGKNLLSWIFMNYIFFVKCYV